MKVFRSITIFAAAAGLLAFASIPSLLRKPEAELWWMPYCPYGQAAARDVMQLLDGGKNPHAVRFRYIAGEHLHPSAEQKAAARRGDVRDSSGCAQTAALQPDFGRFSSLHGRAETEESIRQVIVSRLWPSAFFPYLKAFLDDPNSPWQERALKAGVSVDELSAMLPSDKAAQWFSEEVQDSERRGVNWSPTLGINGLSLDHFPKSQQALREVLCSEGVLRGDCAGVLCDGRAPCPEKLGYDGFCDNGKCNYKEAPQRGDAVNAYLIVPENCVPAQEFPLGDAIKGWAAFLKIKRLNLSSTEAQLLSRGRKMTSFPLLIVESSIVKRAWGSRCIEDLHLVQSDDVLLVCLNYASSPFQSFAEIVYTDDGVQVRPNHYAGGLLLHHMRKLEAAARSYRLALVENPNDYRAWNNLGSILYDSHEMKQLGGAMFRRSMSLHPSYEPALRNLLRFAIERADEKEIARTQERLGWLAIEEKRWSDASELFAEVTKNAEWEFSARKGLAFLAVQEGRLEEALRQTQRCLEINPNPDGDFANFLAGIFFRYGDRGNAIAWYEKAINDPASRRSAYNNLCYLLYSAKLWEKLSGTARAAFASYPEDSAFGIYQAQALARMDRFEESVALFETLARTSAGAAFRASYELALGYHSRMDKLATTDHARKFIQTVSQQAEHQVLDECMEIGKIAMEFGEPDLAAEAFLQVVRMKPSDAGAHSLLMTCYERLGLSDRSREHRMLARQFGWNVK